MEYNSLYVDVSSEYFKCNCSSNERTERATFWWCVQKSILITSYTYYFICAINQNFIGECCELKDDESMDLVGCYACVLERD